VAWVAVTLTGATLAGLAGIPMLEPPLAGDDREKVFITLVDLLFHPVIAGILLAAVLAAIMSTADSQLLVSSATFTEDFYRAMLRREASPRELVAVGRAAVALIAVAAFLIAMDPQTLVLDLVGYAWAGFGAAFGPVLILSLYWSGMTRRGAVAGILTGGITVVVWKHLEGGLFDLYEIVPGFVFSLSMAWLASRLDPTPKGPLSRELRNIRKGCADPP
jgi:sodium/proline symporter